jgi:hypothetical protein
MRFIFAVAGWPGSAHDSRILSHSLENFTFFPVLPKGKKRKFLQSIVICFLATCIVIWY